MTPEQQRIAIAEACGWKILPEIDTSTNCACYAKDPSGDLRCGIPDYLNDLNAMHEAEKVLNHEQVYEFDTRLKELLRPLRAVPQVERWNFHATAAQRAEAFLRTLNLYV